MKRRDERIGDYHVIVHDGDNPCGVKFLAFGGSLVLLYENETIIHASGEFAVISNIAEGDYCVAHICCPLGEAVERDSDWACPNCRTPAPQYLLDLVAFLMLGQE